MADNEYLTDQEKIGARVACQRGDKIYPQVVSKLLRELEDTTHEWRACIQGIVRMGKEIESQARIIAIAKESLDDPRICRLSALRALSDIAKIEEGSDSGGTLV